MKGNNSVNSLTLDKGPVYMYFTFSHYILTILCLSVGYNKLTVRKSQYTYDQEEEYDSTHAIPNVGFLDCVISEKQKNDQLLKHRLQFFLSVTTNRGCFWSIENAEGQSLIFEIYVPMCNTVTIRCILPFLGRFKK